MEWKVTYRSANGNKTTGTFTASSREELFKELSRLELNVIVVEAVARAAHHSNLLSSQCNFLKVIVSALGILAIVVVVTLFFGLWHERSESTGQVSDSPKPQVGSRRNTLKSDIRNATSVVSASTTPVHIEQQPKDDVPPSEKIVSILSVVTNADGAVIERFKTADGKIRSRQSVPHPVFDAPSDQIIALAISGASAGGEMPPMPSLENPNDEFKKSLANEIVINDSDPEDVKSLKRDVISVRNEIRQLISGGQSFADIMREHRELVNKSVVMREEASRLVKEFLDEGDRESATECLTKLNEALREMGVDEIDMPLNREEKRDSIRTQHNRK